MGKQQRTRTTRSEWQRRVVAWKKSGLSAAVFARQHGLSAATLSWWSWKLGAAPAQSESRALALLPVRVAAASAAAAEATTPIEIAIDDYVIRVRAGFDRAALVAVVDALRSRS